MRKTWSVLANSSVRNKDKVHDAGKIREATRRRRFVCDKTRRDKQESELEKDRGVCGVCSAYSVLHRGIVSQAR